VPSEKEALELYNKIRNNKTLQTLEETGFKLGVARGKSIDVDISVIKNSLQKQYDDFQEAYFRFSTPFFAGSMEPVTREGRELNKQKLEKCIADLRNVAGCLFLKINV
jgi:hypothetical protein